MSDQSTNKQLKIRIGRRLRSLREKLNLSQTSLARAVSMPGSPALTTSTISRWETGATAPSAVHLFRLFQELSTTPDAFFRGVSEDLLPEPADMRQESSIKWTPDPDWVPIALQGALRRLEADGVVIRQVANRIDERFWTSTEVSERYGLKMEEFEIFPEAADKHVEFERVLGERVRYLRAQEPQREGPEGLRYDIVFSVDGLRKLVMDDEMYLSFAMLDEFIDEVRTNQHLRIRWAPFPVTWEFAFSDRGAVWSEGGEQRCFVAEARGPQHLPLLWEYFHWAAAAAQDRWLDDVDVQALCSQFEVDSADRLLGLLPLIRARLAKKKVALQRRHLRQRGRYRRPIGPLGFEPMSNYVQFNPFTPLSAAEVEMESLQSGGDFMHEQDL